MSQRIAQLNELIKREIGQIIAREIELPEGSLVTVTQVETSLDLVEAKIWLSIFPVDQAREVMKSLLKKIGHLQGLLNRRLVIRHCPRIKFVLDRTEEKASQVENILNKIEKGNE